MSVFVLDTDILSLWQHGHASVSRHVAAHAAVATMDGVTT